MTRRYELVTNCDDRTQNLLEDLPVSLTYDIAKPSAESTPAKAHGEFGKWLDEIGVNDRVARMMMKVADELESKRSTYSEMGMNALYQIATLPESEREAEHVTAKGETKTPSEMTVRELQELNRQLKQAEERAEAEQRERERLERENEELANREPFISE